MHRVRPHNITGLTASLRSEDSDFKNLPISFSRGWHPACQMLDQSGWFDFRFDNKSIITHKCMSIVGQTYIIDVSVEADNDAICQWKLCQQS